MTAVNKKKKARRILLDRGGVKFFGSNENVSFTKRNAYKARKNAKKYDF